MSSHIAILGWGSLLWDSRPEFDKQHENWEFNGPELRIEFSRISESRGGALTLVIDPLHGARCCVAFARSRRVDPEDVICDLRCRERTIRTNIGYCFADGSRSQFKDPATCDAIRTWALAMAIDAVVWTDLASNFQSSCGRQFSVDSAIEHLRALDVKGRSAAADYIRQAPDFVQTPVRAAACLEPWIST